MVDIGGHLFIRPGTNLAWPFWRNHPSLWWVRYSRLLLALVNHGRMTSNLEVNSTQCLRLK
jgi:hypothetical protein